MRTLVFEVPVGGGADDVTVEVAGQAVAVEPRAQAGQVRIELPRETELKTGEALEVAIR